MSEVRIVTPGKELEVATSACRLFKPLQGITITGVKEIRNLSRLNRFYPTSVVHAVCDVSTMSMELNFIISVSDVLCKLNELVTSRCSGQSGNAVNIKDKYVRSEIDKLFQGFSVHHLTINDIFIIMGVCIVNQPFGDLSGVVGILGANCLLNTLKDYFEGCWIQLPELGTYFSDQYRLFNIGGCTKEGFGQFLQAFCLHVKPDLIG